MKSPAWRLDSRGAAFALVACLACLEARGEGSTTFRDLVEAVRIRRVAVAPARELVAFAELRPRIASDDYEINLYVQPTSSNGAARHLASYVLKPGQVFDRDTHATTPDVAQFTWSGSDARLLYTDHDGGRMQLWIVDAESGDRRLLREEPGTILVGAPGRDGRVQITIRSAAEVRSQADASRPRDDAVRVTDASRFLSPLPEPRPATGSRSRAYSFDWANGTLTPRVDEPQAPGIDARAARQQGLLEFLNSEFSNAETWRSANGAVRVDSRNYRERRRFSVYVENAPASIRKECFSGNLHLRFVGTSADESRLVFLENGTAATTLYELTVGTCAIRKIVETPTSLVRFAALDFGEIDRGGALVFVESAPTRPDRLVKIDSVSGAISSLYDPNGDWAKRTPGVVTRYIRFDDDLPYPEAGGRLFLPREVSPGRKLPLVFTSYGAFLDFGGGVGDELPIIPLVEAGFAVFDLRAVNANRVGSFDLEKARLRDPLAAIQRVIDQLDLEGLVDRQRVGLQGLSYGAEIAGYAWETSKLFRAVSSAGGGQKSPEIFSLSGVASANLWEKRGLPDPFESIAPWRELGGLNASPTMPPMLLQGPDREVLATAPSWVRARRGGAPIEWLVYPDEGHTKTRPANKWWVYSRNYDWFRFWLQDYEDPDPPKKDQYERWRKMRKSD